MEQDKQYGGLDVCKIIAAVLVIAIHISPFALINGNIDFFLTRIIARTAVPFFLMVSGFFLFPLYLFQKSKDAKPFLFFLKKIMILYAFAIVIYLPINFYAGQFQGMGASDAVRLILFDGTFYHLWYLPAVILGTCILYVLGKKLSFRKVIEISLFLYVIGLFGDSYYGLSASVPFLNAFYNGMFQFFSYTRNGLFYVPIFMAMGAWIGQTEHRCSLRGCITGLIVSTLLMTVEGFLLHSMGWQRHDSMYISLIFCMYFLFQLILMWNRKPSRYLRNTATIMYLIHPIIIIAVRGFAKAFHLSNIIVDQNLIFFLLVVIVSILVSAGIAKLWNRPVQKVFQRGRAWIELDRKALEQNVAILQQYLPNGCELMPAIKTNAYGHGAVLIARQLNRLKIHAFCVATAQEGAELRKNGIFGTILVLGYTHELNYPLLIQWNLTQTVLDLAYAKELNHYGKKISVHVKIDTGMHRLGERSDRINEIIQIFQCKNLKIEGVFTHLCAADQDDSESIAYTHRQANAFYKAVQQIESQGYSCAKKHIVSSAGLIHYPEYAEDYARVGIALYGTWSTNEETKRCSIPLRPVLSLKARVALVKNVYPGEKAGYGLQFTAKKDTRIAVVAIGYGDGIPRSLSCKTGNVLIQGKKVPILGRMCMDQTLVDVSSIPNVKAGDIAVIIGQSGQESITACDIAEQTGTIANEILSRLGERLERRMV